MKKIFLLGSERSGSNLLRTLIGRHSQISAPVALHLLNAFMPRYQKYCPVDNEKLQKIYSVLNLFVNHEFNDWHMNIEPSDMVDKYKPHDFIDILNSIYSEKAEMVGKKAYFSKDNDNHHYALGIKMKFPDAAFIYLYRDPRDQVASWLRAPFHLHTPYRAISVWMENQQVCQRLKDFYGLPMLSVKYEDLIENTSNVMAEVLRHLDLPVENQCFETKKNNKDADKHLHWQNLSKPVMSGNSNKYQDVLKGDDLTMVETLAADHMERLGYRRVTSGKWRMSNKRIFHLRDKFRARLVMYRNRNREGMELLVDKIDFIRKNF